MLKERATISLFVAFIFVIIFVRLGFGMIVNALSTGDFIFLLAFLVAVVFVSFLFAFILVLLITHGSEYYDKNGLPHVTKGFRDKADRKIIAERNGLL